MYASQRSIKDGKTAMCNGCGPPSRSPGKLNCKRLEGLLAAKNNEKQITFLLTTLVLSPLWGSLETT